MKRLANNNSWSNINARSNSVLGQILTVGQHLAKKIVGQKNSWSNIKSWSNSTLGQK